MLRCRLLEEHAATALQLPAQQAEETANGREAIAVGATATLRADDCVAASAFDTAPFVATGAPLQEIVEHWAAGLDFPVADPARPAESTLWKGRVRVPAKADPFHAATGQALTDKLEGNRQVVVAFAPDEPRELGRWQSAFKIASAQRLPVVYVLARREWAATVGKTTAGRSPDDFPSIVKRHGFRGIVVDGNDVVAVYRVAQESIHHARLGTGPTLIECKLQQGEFLPEGVNGGDALGRLERYMKKHEAWSDFWHQQVVGQVRAEVEHAIEPFRRAAVRA